MKSKRNGSLFLAAGAVLLLGALGLTGYNLWDENRAAAAADSVMDALNEVIVPVSAVTPEDSAAPTGEVRIPDYILGTS